MDCFVASLAANKFPVVPSPGRSDIQLQRAQLQRHHAVSLLQCFTINQFRSRLMQVIKSNSTLRFQQTAQTGIDFIRLMMY